MTGITVGIDGSDHAHHALAWAMREAAVRQAPLTVLVVNEVPESGWTGAPILLPADDVAEQECRKAAEEAISEVSAELGESQPASVTTEVVSGFPARELIRASADADLVVVGSRGSGGFAQLMTGSVSSQVTQHAHCPVAVIRHAR